MSWLEEFWTKIDIVMELEETGQLPKEDAYHIIRFLWKIKKRKHMEVPHDSSQVPEGGGKV